MDSVESIYNRFSDITQSHRNAAYAHLKMNIVAEEESDRSAAILTASFIDDLLSEMLQAFLIEDKEVKNLFKGYSPLSSFSARIDVAYALGLITAEMKADLNVIRKIRNHFAHHWDNTGFEIAPVSDFCQNFHITSTVGFSQSVDGTWAIDPKALWGDRENKEIRLGNDSNVLSNRKQFTLAAGILINCIQEILVGIKVRKDRRIASTFNYLGPPA